ncbi:MAG TPA: aminotransferase class V-fold PLP-dependent enzyme [Burkholderiales bacterium]|nr:aminotransferase class V-fold PLP-dependent enzyme [Burkholderiales bacterium]
MQPDWNTLRDEFPTLRHWTYMDTARKTIPPRCQAQAMQDYTRDVYENAGADAWSATNVADTRDVMAALLGAKPAELAFTKNTTEGLSIVANGVDLKPGDNIVLTDMEHVANIWVWKHWEARGVEIRYAQSRERRLPLESFLAKLDERTRVVSTAYVTYSNGYRVDLPALGKACRERGALLVVDGVQGAGIIATPLCELGADFIAIGGHKHLLGLTGSGLVWCREGLVNKLNTPFVKPPAPPGSVAPSAHANSQFDYMRIAHRFEGGNPNFLGLRVLRRGAEFLQSIGLSHIESRVRELTASCLAHLKRHSLKTTTPENWSERAQIVNVLVPDADRLMNVLRDKHRVVINVKDNALRLSMSFFNNEDDIERAVRAIATEAGA